MLHHLCHLGRLLTLFTQHGLAIMVGVFCYVGSLEAARNAVVISEKAIIWADAKRSAPLGFARKGKSLRVGNMEREKGQVVAVVVSGKIAYIALEDVAIAGVAEEETREDEKLSRFKKSSEVSRQGHLIASGALFGARETKDNSAGRSGDDWSFQGGQLKGTAHLEGKRLGVGVLLEYLYTEQEDESFRLFNIGLGPSLRLINFDRMKLNLEALLLLVPWAQYEARPLFTLNGFGLGALGQGSLLLFPAQNWGVEVSAGLQAVQVFKIKRPAPFKEFSPLFVGAKLSAGLVYRF